MGTERLSALRQRLTHETVLGELLAPAHRALERVRGVAALSRVLSMTDFITLGVLRHLLGMRSLREQVQALLHLAPGTATRPPLARSTWSDALASPRRRAVLQTVTEALLRTVRATLPDRLADLPGLGPRMVFALDGTYEKESAHFRPWTPRQGGDHNPKGHALLTFYDVRLGLPLEAHVETRSRHELLLLRDYDRGPPP
jgi:hypothetical protein